MLSFTERLQAAKTQAQQAATAHPWLFEIGRLRGDIRHDGVEWVSTQRVLDYLGVPPNSRRSGLYRTLTRVMAEAGWTAMRAKDCTRGGYHMRGFRRQPNRDWAVRG